MNFLDELKDLKRISEVSFYPVTFADPMDKADHQAETQSFTHAESLLY
jgi:hypothetical protein